MSLAALDGDDVVAADAGPSVLARIREPGVHLALWRREVPEELSGLAGLDWSAIHNVDQAVPVALLAGQLPIWLKQAGYGGTATALAREIVTLAELLVAVMGCTWLRVRLEVIETDACSRFHADYVSARLLMPLVGPGTQWLRAGTEGPIDELRAGDVGLFKGRLWAEDPAVLHRSPAVAAIGETRLLLTLDPRTASEAVEL